MRKYCTTIKNKAYIFLEVLIISFLFISLTLFVQILLNNSFKLYKVDYKTQENFQNLDFLNEIMKVEIRYIEKNINDDGTVVPVAMRQIKGIAAAMDVPMPVVMAQIPSDQELVVHVVAESDQPHAK